MYPGNILWTLEAYLKAGLGLDQAYGMEILAKTVEG